MSPSPSISGRPVAIGSQSKHPASVVKSRSLDLWPRGRKIRPIMDVIPRPALTNVELSNVPKSPVMGLHPAAESIWHLQLSA